MTTPKTDQPNPRRPRRGTYRPQPETLALLKTSGNAINGLGETTPRQASPFFWHSPEMHPFGELQALARRNSRKCPGSDQAFMAAYNFPELVPVSEARKVLLIQESDKLVDREKINRQAIDRVELADLTKDDFVRILHEPRHSLTKQQVELLATEGLTVEFTEDAIETMAALAFDLNRRTQNIGARRLYTIIERVVEGISFEAPDLPEKKILIDSDYVNQRLAGVIKDEDLSRFIL